MNETIRNGLQYCLSYFLLRGHGWHARKRLVTGTQRREWQDPESGNWYGTKKAMEILQHQMIALYPASTSRSSRFSLHC